MMCVFLVLKYAASVSLVAAVIDDTFWMLSNTTSKNADDAAVAVALVLLLLVETMLVVRHDLNAEEEAKSHKEERTCRKCNFILLLSISDLGVRRS